MSSFGLPKSLPDTPSFLKKPQISLHKRLSTAPQAMNIPQHTDTQMARKTPRLSLASSENNHNCLNHICPLLRLITLPFQTQKEGPDG